MRVSLIFSALAISIVTPSPSFAADFCKDILVDPATAPTELRAHTFFHQLIAAEYAEKTDEQIEKELGHNGSMTWAGIVFGGSFNKNDFKRYIHEIRNKLDLKTVFVQKSSTLLASGDPTIVKAWSDCMSRLRGLSIRFEAQSPTKALLIFEWYAYPVAERVSSDTHLKDDVKLPDGVRVIAGNECLKKGNPLRDKVACTVNLELPDGETDLLVVANVIHGTADAYLPSRRVLKAEREKWRPQPGELETVQVYTYENGKASQSVCVTPKKDWSFVDATMEAKAYYRSGRSDAARCVGQIQPRSPSYLCFNSYIAPTAKSDNRCEATLTGEIIRWVPVDGLGLARGASVTSPAAFLPLPPN